MAPPTDYEVVDLLQASPLLRVDGQAVDTALVFCFSGSKTGGLFSDALAAAPVPPSKWEPQCFAADLFVERLVRDCMKGPAPWVTTQHLMRVIAQPPSDLASVELRRGILVELSSSPTARLAFNRLYAELLRFRNVMEGTGARNTGSIHRTQLDGLDAFAKLIQIMRDEFGGTQSGLSRLGEFGAKAAQTEPYQSLLSLLSYDQGHASVDLRVRLGSDGTIRDLQLGAVHERTDNPFVNSPWRRWGAKIELLFRGYGFSHAEVMARLVDAVFEGVRPYLVALVQLLGDLEFYLGALHFKARAEAAGLRVCLPEFKATREARRIHGLFNPLLLAAGIKPVPCSIETDRHNTTLLITGPNSGGKTRLLQAVGLTQLMAQSGLFVPAAEACLARSSGLVVSLIQETHADQTEGRLGMELMRIRDLFERLPVGAIVILDELCSGTNPSEGEEIFELVVDMLERLQPQAFITTHFLEFAARLEKARRIEGLRFLQVELGPGHAPTYQFTSGVASTSLAHQAAARLGVTGDQLLALIDRKLRDHAS